MRIPDPGIFFPLNPGSGIWDGKKSDPECQVSKKRTLMLVRALWFFSTYVIHIGLIKNITTAFFGSNVFAANIFFSGKFSWSKYLLFCP
jgi:hypothetical protein